MLTLSITISVPSNITINRLMCIEKERGGGGWEGEGGEGGREGQYAYVVIVMIIVGKQHLCGAYYVAGTILSTLNILFNPLTVL